MLTKDGIATALAVAAVLGACATAWVAILLIREVVRVWGRADDDRP